MKLLTLSMILILIAACGKKDEDDDLVVAGDKGEGILTKANNAVSAFGTSVGGSSILALNPSISSISSCTDGALNDVTQMRTLVACLVTNNSGNPETVRGAFHVIKSITEILEANASMDFSSTPKDHEDISGTITNSGSSASISFGIVEQGLSGQFWDYKIQFCFQSGHPSTQTNLAACKADSKLFPFILYLKESNSKIGFKALEVDTSDGSIEVGTIFLMDSTTDELRFESWDKDRRHSRLYVKATIGNDFVLTNPTEGAIVHADAFEASGDGIDGLYTNFSASSMCANTKDYTDSDQTTLSGSNDDNDLALVGSCGSYPVYNGSFFSTTSYSQSAFQTFIKDENKGDLNFTAASMSASSYYIDN